MKFWSVATLGNIAQWVGAIGTIAAVLVALFKEWIISLLRGPVLEISDIHCILLPVVAKKDLAARVNTKGYFYRFWVENKGKTAANEVQVFVCQLERRIADGTFQREPEFLNVNLLWAHESEAYARRILPRMGKHCDIGHIVDPNHRAAANEDVPELPSEQSVLALALEVKRCTAPTFFPQGPTTSICKSLPRIVALLRER
jgi:hypothetical protein